MMPARMASRGTVTTRSILLVGISVDDSALSAFLDHRFSILKARHVNAACSKMALTAPTAVIAQEKAKPWDLHVLRENLARDSMLHLVGEQASVEELATLINTHHPVRNVPRL